MKDSVRNEYLEFQMKIMLRFCVNAVISVAAVIVLYLFLWRKRGGNLIVWFLEHFIRMEHEQAFLIYHYYFRNCKEIFFAAAILLIFISLLYFLFRWMTRYFQEINQGIDALLAENIEKIHSKSQNKV